MEEITIWKDFGFPGLVTGALFVGLWFIFVKIVVPLLESQKDQICKQTESHNLQIQQLVQVHQAQTDKHIELHKEERKEWRDTFVEQGKETNEVVRNLTAAVQEMNSRHRKFDRSE